MLDDVLTANLDVVCRAQFGDFYESAKRPDYGGFQPWKLLDIIMATAEEMAEMPWGTTEMPTSHRQEVPMTGRHLCRCSRCQSRYETPIVGRG